MHATALDFLLEIILKNQILEVAEYMSTLLCRFTNCKLSVQSKVGLQWLAKREYLNVHKWDVCPLSL